MQSDFIAIKNLEGELKMTHKKNDFGLTVTDKEFVYQKPHMNVHVKLEDIVSIVPYETPEPVRIKFVNKQDVRNEITRSSSAIPCYRLYVRQALMHNRSGITTLNAAQVVMPILKDLLQTISKHSGLQQI